MPLKVGVLTVPVGVSVCVCVASAEPVKVSAGTVNELPGDEPPIVLNAPLEVPALLPVTVATVAVPLVPAGVPALTALVVPWLPAKVGVETVPAGVMLSVPPVPPTSALALIVPRGKFPLSALLSVNPMGHAPLAIITISPEKVSGVFMGGNKCPMSTDKKKEAKSIFLIYFVAS